MIGNEKLNRNIVTKTAKAGLTKLVFSRVFLIAFLVLIQAVLFLSTFYWLKSYAAILQLIYSLIGVMVVIYIINESGNSAFKLAWMLFILMFPLAGSLFFLYSQLDIGVRHIGSRLAVLRKETDSYLKQDKKILESLEIRKAADINLARYMGKQVGYPMCRNTKVTYLSTGEDAFLEMKCRLSQAKKFIFMEYFIVEPGMMWNSILDILEEKVKEGVEVRFMYDGMCSIGKLPFHYRDVLGKKGIKCRVFNQIRPMLSTIQNNRDHRKICVVDGVYGFTGGVNLADEYINQVKRFGHWKDNAVMLEGEAVQNMTMMFLQMWNVSGGKTEKYSDYLSPRVKENLHGLGFVMPYGDSPFDHENVGEEVYFHILNHAKKYVHIMTPYLILDNGMMNTLTRAAKSGVEIVIIMPHIPDKWYAFVLAKTYYTELIQSGVKIYEYRPGFVHAKMFVSDDEVASIGSINLDFRSLYLHFECGVYISGNQEVWKMEEDFQETLKKCHRVTLMEVEHRSNLEKLVGQLLKLIAPLM